MTWHGQINRTIWEIEAMLDEAKTKAVLYPRKLSTFKKSLELKNFKKCMILKDKKK